MTQLYGPVPVDSPMYVERKFESEVNNSLLKRDWVLLLGPRQHGKTSALLRIRNYMNEVGFECAFVDLQTLPATYTFPEILEWFSRRISKSLKSKPASSYEGDSNSLEDWLEWAIQSIKTPVIVVIDEAASIRDEAIRNAFYGQIRAIKTAAMIASPESFLRSLQFVFAGTFRPETLVDDKNSPFNVCTRIETEDLDVHGISALVREELTQDETLIKSIADDIYEKVGGQPHLVQTLLSSAEYVEKDAIFAAIEKEYQNIKSNGNDHTRSLFRSIVKDPALLKIASFAVDNGTVQNDAANDDCKFSVVIGLLKLSEKNLLFRNKLYAEIAKASTQINPEMKVEQQDNLMLHRMDIANFSFIADVQYREIAYNSYNGAITSSNKGSLRLAIIGFGMALEAILLDWISNKKMSDINAAISGATGDAKPNFNGQHQNDPTTWHLINLIKVAKLMKSVTNPTNPPHSLRELRNLVHPSVIKRNYFPDDALKPEIHACVGLLGIVMREIQS